MRSKILLLITLFFFLKIYSQENYNKKTSDLVSLIQNEKNERKKLDYYIDLSKLYLSGFDLDNLKKTNKNILIISKKYNSQYAMAFYYMNEAYTMFYDNPIHPDNKKFEYALKAQTFFKNYRDFDHYFLVTSHIALFYLANEKYDLSEKLLNENISLAQKTNNKNISKLYLTKIMLHNFKGEYADAIIYGNKIIKSKISEDDRINAYHQIAIIYASLNNFDKAIEYNNLAYSLAESSAKKKRIQFSKLEIYNLLQQYNSILNIPAEDKNYFLNNRIYSHSFKLMLMRCYFHTRNYKMSEQYAVECLALNPIRKDVETESNAYLGLTKLKQGQLKSAKIHIRKALKMLKDDDYLDLRILVYNAQSELEQTLGNYQNALYYEKKILDLKDQLYSEYNKKNIQQLQIDFDISKKENKIKNLEISNLKKEVALNKNKRTIIIFLLLFVMFVIIIVSLLFFIRLKKNKNKQILNYSKKLEKEKEVTLKSLQEKEILIKEIHHRVKNNMQMVTSLLKIQSRNSENISIDEFIRSSSERIQSMALVHDYLYRADDLKEINFKKYVLNLVDSVRKIYKDSTNIIIETNIEEKVSFEIETMVPLGLIINELIINAYKHAFQSIDEGRITIELFTENNHYKINVKDNGIGMKTVDKNINQKKTVGLKIVDILVTQIGAKHTVKTNKGTHVSIIFPVNQ